MAATQKPLSFSLGPLNTKYILDLVAKQKLVNSRYNRSIYMDDLITHLRTKAKPKKKPKAEFISAEVEGLNIKAWQTWIDYRRLTKCKKYKTDKTMKELAKMGSHDDQMKIVMISVNKEYQGLFALKGGNSSQGKTSGNRSACEDFING